MIPVQFVLVGAAFNVVGLSSYVADTLRGRNRPNRVTWFLWALAPLIAFAAELRQGVGLQSLMTFMVGFGPAVVLGASFVSRHGAARLTRFDLGCGSLSVVALIMWRVTGRGDVAIAFSRGRRPAGRGAHRPQGLPGPGLGVVAGLRLLARSAPPSPC